MAKDIPGISASQAGENAKPLERIREELQTLLGFRGDALDAAITYRQAVERGLIDRLGRALTGSPSYTNVYPIAAGGGGAPAEPDLTPPPSPSGLVVTAGFTQVIVEWNSPAYTTRSGTATNLQTNVYAVKRTPGDPTLPTFAPGSTPRVFVAQGALNIVSLPSELNTRWHVWITFMSVDMIESLTPAGGVNGFNVAGAFPTTGQDIAQLLSVLSGQITTSQLATALNTRINLVDASAAVAGSVNARIATETTNRTNADFAQAGRTDLLEARVITPSATPGDAAYNVTYAGLLTEQGVRASLDGAVQALYTVRAQVSSGGATMVGGFGLAATATAGGGATIDFGVIASRFYVGAPNDGSAPGIPDSLPFIIQATPTTINGVAVPAGTYIRDAFILNGSITNAKIGNAAIDDAKIANLSAVKINTGFLSADRIQANSLTADKINARGLNILDASGNLVLSAGASLNSQVSAAAIGAVQTSLTNAPPGILNSNLTGAIAAASTTAEWSGVTGPNRPADNATVGAPNGTFVGPLRAEDVESAAAAQAKANAAQAEAIRLAALDATAKASAAQAEATRLANIELTGKLNKNAADTLSAPITLSSSGAIQTTNGSRSVTFSPGGIVAMDGGAVKMAFNTSDGSLALRGDLSSGSAARSGTTMTGTGFSVVASNGSGCWGNSTVNITHDGTTIRINGPLVTDANLNLNTLSLSSDVSSVSLYPSDGTVATTTGPTVTAGGGATPYAYSWTMEGAYTNPAATAHEVWVSGTSLGGRYAAPSVVMPTDNSTINATMVCTVIDGNGRSARVEVALYAQRGTAP